jgi:hypothetical protein
VVAPETVRVAVFIDWQNAYRAARRAFGLERMPVERGNFSPYRLACLLAAAQERGRAAELVTVEVHRGLPSQNYDEVGYVANQRLPVPEAVARLAGPGHVETASWASSSFNTPDDLLAELVPQLFERV